MKQLKLLTTSLHIKPTTMSCNKLHNLKGHFYVISLIPMESLMEEIVVTQ